MIYRVHSVDANNRTQWQADFRNKHDALVWLNIKNTVFKPHLEFVLEEVPNSTGS